ncbi:chromate efflux transporter [Paenibacillus sp. LHD-117]|nr:chromate efflux transporter [Paenibacillus sp. LHD-117]MDQ6419753.1 chromate efflux transporter [Paenibacillus sp. LHD-117]
MSGRGKRLWELFAVSTKLGLTSFGGPIAHLGYFHEEYVRRRKWLDEGSYADIVALAQFLPGPASSQVGIGIGIMRGGLIGGAVSMAGFTLPSAIVLAVFALLLQGAGIVDAGWLHGLKLVAVAIVAQAVWGMGQKLAAGRTRMTMAILSAAIVLLWNAAYSQVAVIAAAALAGWWLFGRRGAGGADAASGSGTGKVDGNQAVDLVRPKPADSIALGPSETDVPGVSRIAGFVCLALFLLLLLVLPLARELTANHWIAMADGFYRSGSLVFGGGHVVLPLLESEVVPTGWVTEEQFLAGYSAAQAVPGPLFTFASFLGAASDGWLGGLAATLAIFLPAYLLMAGAMPFWQTLRALPKVQHALAGANAAVVGILLAALYDPIWTSAVASTRDFVLAASLFVLLVYWKLPPWTIVLLGAAGGYLVESMG